MKDEIKEILGRLEIVARKHTIEVCDDGSKIETMPASLVDELRLNNYSSKLLLNYITNLQKENERLKDLCDKYEEEHNTVFKLWKGKLKETMDETLIQKQHDRIKELEQINEEHRKLNGMLREENKRLEKDYYEEYDNHLKDKTYYFNLFEYYKTRNEKAIEYIRQCQLGVDSLDRPYMLLDQEEGKELLNILQNGEENE